MAAESVNARQSRIAIAKTKPNMNLDEAQRKKVADWIAQGLKLSEIQSRLASELGIRMTYMEVRLLADDLKLTPKDPEPPRNAAALAGKAAPAEVKPEAAPLAGAGANSTAGSVSIQADQIARPGAVVSGKVVFSDGERADWYLDQSGRLGLAPQRTGYRPAPDDVQQFQVKLEALLSKMGL